MLHTGDWKIDPTPIIGPPTDEKRLRELGDAGVLALVGDSTNAVRDGRSPSEAEVAKTIAELVKAAKGRVAVTTFASNVARVRAVAEAAKAGRPRSRGGRPRHGAGGAGGARMRLSRRRAEFPRHGPLRPFPAGQGAGAVHRQPGRAARGAGAHRQQRPSGGDAEQGRLRDLLLAHHSRQREGGRRHHQRPRRAGRRGHHRPHPSRPRLRPSAPRRAARHHLLGAAADPDSRAWRGAASGRARQARARGRRAEGDDLPQRRPGQARPGRRRHHRRAAGGAALQGRQDPGGCQIARGGRAAQDGLCRLRLRRHRHDRKRRAGRRSRG